MTWIKKKIGPGIYNVTTLDEAEKVLTSENKVVLGYLNSLVVCFTFILFFLFWGGGGYCVMSVLFVIFTVESL